MIHSIYSRQLDRSDKHSIFMDKVTPVFAVARASPEGTKLCNRWVSDELWTGAVNFTAQEDLTTTKLFNRSMSNAFMDLDCFN